MSVTPVQMYRTSDGKLFDSETAAVRHQEVSELEQVMADAGEYTCEGIDLKRVAEYLIDNFKMEKRA